MGRAEFETIVASAPRESVVWRNMTLTASIAAGATEIQDVFAPTNTICNLINLYLHAEPVPASTAGTHQFTIESNAPWGSYIFGRSLYNEVVEYDDGDWQIATQIKRPPSNGQMNINSLHFDEILPMRIRYTNNANTSQTNNRITGITYVQKIIG